MHANNGGSMDGNVNKEGLKISKAFALVISLCLVIVFAVGGYWIFFKCAMPGNEIPPTLAAGAEKQISTFARLYLGLTNVSIKGEEWKNNEWIFNMSASGSSAFGNFEIRTDRNLTLSSFRVFGKINVPKTPPTYQELYGLNCKSDKSVIDVYVDPYDPWTRKYFDTINNISDKFSDSAAEKFHVVNPYTSKLEGYKWAVVASKYLVCAKKDSDTTFIKTTKCIFNRLNENNNTILNETELDTCISSTELKMSNESFRTCLDNESIQLLTQDGEYTQAQMGDISTTYIVINCKYETFPMYMDVVLCHVEPDMPACKDVS